MPKKKYDRSGGKNKGWVSLWWIMLNSRAYRGLPSSAAKLLPFFLGKIQYMSYEGPEYYKTTFSFTYAEARRQGQGRSTFYKTIKILISFGWIDPVKQGGRRSCGMTDSIFKLSSRWKVYGKPEFKQVKGWPCFLSDEDIQSQIPKMDTIGPKSGLKKARDNFQSTNRTCRGAK
jgi:hypothetical protein